MPVNVNGRVYKKMVKQHENYLMRNKNSCSYKREGDEIKVAEKKTARFSLGETRLDS